MWPAVKAMLHPVYDQPDATAVTAQFDRLLDYVEQKLPEVFEHLDRACADLRIHRVPKRWSRFRWRVDVRWSLHIRSLGGASEMTRNMQWRDAMVKVLQEAEGPLHYSEIAQAIIDKGYRQDVGATPAATVAANLSESLRRDERSPFVKHSRGVYALAEQTPGDALDTVTPDAADEAVEDAEEMGLINAFGMFWSRDRVRWNTKMPRLLGVQQSGSYPVNFTAQAGIYVLYDGSRAVYVGRVTEPRMGLRLFEHTRDRLTGRWDRFSWFGVRGVRDDGELAPVPSAGIPVSTLIATMEALLIEGLEPPQNRRQGDGFSAVEFIQETDRELLQERDRKVLDQLKQQAGL